MEGTGCSQIAAAPTCSCACCCEGGSPAAQGGGVDQHCTQSPSSSPPSCACRCTCNCTCGNSGMQPDIDQEEQLKQVNTVFSAAEAALQAFWRASIARVEMNAENAGSEAAYSQVKTAARSQAAASIAWVLAAASVVLKDDADEEEDDNAGAHCQYPGRAGPHYQYPGRAGPHYQYPEFYPLHRRDAAPDNTQIIKRYDVQLGRSNMHGAARSSYYKSHMQRNHSIPRWEWRPIRNSNNSTYSSNSCMSSPPCAASPSPSLNKPPSCSSMISTCAAPAPADQHPYSNPSITISSLLPPLINCRISNAPYNQETLINSKANPKANNPTTHNPSQSSDEVNPNYPIKIHEAWSTPPHIENDNIAIDIIDTQVVTKSSVEPFHIDKETLEEPLNIEKDIDEEEEKEKTILDLTQDSPTHVWGEDNTFSFINCPSASSSCDLHNDSKPSQQDADQASSTLQGGKNHKKHLKKKQRKASTSHL